MRWSDLTTPWKRSFLQAWEAYCNGSIPIGSVLVNQQGEIVLEGRNRVLEGTAPVKQVFGNRLAHAEMNVLLQLNGKDYEEMSEATIYSTMEPCIQCFGAIILSKVRNICFAATDDKLAGATTIKDEHGFIESRNLNIRGPFPILGEVQMVLRTDFLLRTFTTERAEELIAAHAIDYPIGVSVGRTIFQLNTLQEVKNVSDGFPLLFDELVTKIKQVKQAHSV
ncbi:nucleoside deaminase [Paucisalibacillus sp. EB02]|uniref:nucleoside deaminase n=1 Tax=Paucisalibacillus sp. EB02 TaxID=1347087 RepID=UPI0005A78FC3|nr:nucleoside deaminase [Paucisalibacillus sp. EB02]